MPLNRYAARLLFQFRVDCTPPGKMRTCEERIVVVRAKNGRDAVARIEKKRPKYEYDYENANGDRVFFEFIGIRDLIDLAVLEEDEVWYDIRTMLSPMERKDRLIPDVEELLARL